MKKYAVKYKNISLMPCSKRRAKSLIRCGKAKFSYDKVLGKYVKLLKEPSGFNVQEIALGIDTGTMYSGFSVVGDDVSFNFEIEHTQKIKKKEYIKEKTETRQMYRRLKRNRLRHRKVRFRNRTGKKVTATENYYYQNIRNMVDKLVKFFPIQDIVIEDVAHVHTKENPGSGFSPIEQIKTRLNKHCSEIAAVWISKANPKIIRKYNWAELRRRASSTIRDLDLKTQDKSEKPFYAHCIDSHSLACLVFRKHLAYSDEMLYISRRLPNIDKNRRNLRREMTKRNAKKRRHSKLRKIRVKVNQFQGNHGPWEYQYTNIEGYTVSKAISPYGTSIKISNSHCKNCKKGENKYKKKCGYNYYNVQYIKTPEILNHVPYYLSYSLPEETFERVTLYSG